MSLGIYCKSYIESGKDFENEDAYKINITLRCPEFEGARSISLLLTGEFIRKADQFSEQEIGQQFLYAFKQLRKAP